MCDMRYLDVIDGYSYGLESEIIYFEEFIQVKLTWNLQTHFTCTNKSKKSFQLLVSEIVFGNG